MTIHEEISAAAKMHVQELIDDNTVANRFEPKFSAEICGQSFIRGARWVLGANHAPMPPRKLVLADLVGRMLGGDFYIYTDNNGNVSGELGNQPVSVIVKRAVDALEEIDRAWLKMEAGE